MGETMSTDLEWVDAMRDTHRVLARAQYADIELITGWFRRGAAADYARSGGLLHSSTEGASAAVEAAAVLRMSESAVNRAVHVGLSLDDLPYTKTAFAEGNLDLDRVRVIIDVTTPCNAEARAELDRRLAERGKACSPNSLRTAGRRWALKLDPASESARRKLSIEDRDIRVRATARGMSVLDGLLPVDAAQTVAFRLADMARQDVCARDPRTFPQRRADALVALADGSSRLACRCDLGSECPKASETGATAARSLIQVGVSLETLLGLQNWPGYIAGAGAIDPDLARTLAKDGRWEWIIAAIDAAAAGAGARQTMPDESNADEGTDATGGLESLHDECNAANVMDEACASESDSTGPQSDTHSVSTTIQTVGTENGVVSVRAYESDTTTESPSGPTTSSSEATTASAHDRAKSPSDTTASPNRRAIAPPHSTGRRAGAAAKRAVAAACGALSGEWDDPNSCAALRYSWPAPLARWLRARDVTCRFPGCVVPAAQCDVDHTIRFDHTDPRNGGRTTRSNGACLCRRHHGLKTAGENGQNGWRVRQLGHGRLEWRTPTGEIVVTEPEGADTLWPESDVILTQPRVSDDRARVTELATRAGLTLADESTYAAITANAPYWSRIEEHLEYLVETCPPRGRPQSTTLAIEYEDDDEPPPF